MTPDDILRKGRTEPPFSGQYNHWDKTGTFTCADCGNPLFHTEQKFDSGTGWPSFTAPLSSKSVDEYPDLEVKCQKCNGHLGHVFDDGPPPTSRRYCINSLALNFQKA